MLALCSASAGLLLPQRVGNVRMMATVDEFSISKEIKAVRVFEGDYASDIVEEVTFLARESIDLKGSFSLAIPGGSVVSALAGIDKDAFDVSKMHVFFCNEKIPSFPCVEGALEATKKFGLPKENVHGFGEEGTPAEIASGYTKLLQTHESIDNSGSIPSFDMMLLGTGPDGHCGCIFPDSAEVKATGKGEVVLAGNDDRADGDFVAVSMDVMCATKTVIVSAAGAGRADMVATALSGEFGPYDCPAGMVEAKDNTLWFTDTEGIAAFEEEMGEDYEDAE